MELKLLKGKPGGQRKGTKVNLIVAIPTLSVVPAQLSQKLSMPEILPDQFGMEKDIYLATFINLFTREIVGWSISTRHTYELIEDAFKEAITFYGVPKMDHTDQGSEYTSKNYIKLMESLVVKISMSKKGSPWENGYQESFYDNFKTDLGLEFERFETVGEFTEASTKQSTITTPKESTLL